MFFFNMSVVQEVERGAISVREDCILGNATDVGWLRKFGVLRYEKALLLMPNENFGADACPIRGKNQDI